MTISLALRYLANELQEANISLPTLLFDYEDYCKLLQHQQQTEANPMIEFDRFKPSTEVILCGFSVKVQKGL